MAKNKYELIIAEKPDAAEKIAEALADKKPQRKNVNKVPYYELEHKGKKIMVGCAVGHLFTLVEKEKNGWNYPVFDVIWAPAHTARKASEFSKKYLDVLKKFAKCDIPSRVDPKLLRPTDVTLQIPDVTKFSIETGWKPRYSFEESVKYLLDHCRSEVQKELPR